MPSIDVQCHPILLSKMPKDSLFLSGGWIFAQCPNAAEGIAADEVVGVEFDDRGGDHIEKFLDTSIVLHSLQYTGVSF